VTQPEQNRQDAARQTQWFRQLYNFWLRKATGVFVLLIIKRLRAVTFSHQWFQFSDLRTAGADARSVKSDLLGLRVELSCGRGYADYFADMKRKRDSRTLRPIAEPKGKRLAQAYQELLRLRELVKKAEKKSSKRRSRKAPFVQRNPILEH
jgi:hypothetical protein